MLSKDVEEYYDNFAMMFKTKGWEQLSTILVDNINTIKIENLADAKALHQAQGQLAVLTMVFSLPEHIAAQREHVEQQQDNAEEYEDA